jgi:hypothetical protein
MEDKMYSQETQHTLQPDEARELATAAVKLGQNEVWIKRFGYASDDVTALTQTVNGYCKHFGEDASRIVSVGRILGVEVEGIKRFGYPLPATDMDRLLTELKQYASAFHGVVSKQVAEIEERNLGTWGLDTIVDPSLN